MKEEKRNHLRRIRLGAGLQQQDVAYLLELKSHETISRIEHHKAIPSVGILLAYSVIFGEQLKSMIPYAYFNQQRLIMKRAQSLHKKLHLRNGCRHQKIRLAFLKNMARRNHSGIKKVI